MLRGRTTSGLEAGSRAWYYAPVGRTSGTPSGCEVESTYILREMLRGVVPQDWRQGLERGGAGERVEHAAVVQPSEGIAPAHQQQVGLSATDGTGLESQRVARRFAEAELGAPPQVQLSSRQSTHKHRIAESTHAGKTNLAAPLGSS